MGPGTVPVLIQSIFMTEHFWGAATSFVFGFSIGTIASWWYPTNTDSDKEFYLTVLQDKKHKHSNVTESSEEDDSVDGETSDNDLFWIISLLEGMKQRMKERPESIVQPDPILQPEPDVQTDNPILSGRPWTPEFEHDDELEVSD
jgi:hypothetical protein